MKLRTLLFSVLSLQVFALGVSAHAQSSNGTSNQHDVLCSALGAEYSEEARSALEDMFGSSTKFPAKQVAGAFYMKAKERGVLPSEVETYLGQNETHQDLFWQILANDIASSHKVQLFGSIHDSTFQADELYRLECMQLPTSYRWRELIEMTKRRVAFQAQQVDPAESVTEADIGEITVQQTVRVLDTVEAARIAEETLVEAEASEKKTLVSYDQLNRVVEEAVSDRHRIYVDELEPLKESNASQDRALASVRADFNELQGEVEALRESTNASLVPLRAEVVQLRKDYTQLDAKVKVDVLPALEGFETELAAARKGHNSLSDRFKKVELVAGGNSDKFFTAYMVLAFIVVGILGLVWLIISVTRPLRREVP